MRIFALAAVIGCCSFMVVAPAIALDEAPVSSGLAPMPKPPDRKVGYTAHLLKNGEPFFLTLVAIDGAERSWKDSDCEWSDLDTWFSPSTKWRGCRGGRTGANDVSPVEGQVWPLKVGNTWRYNYSGSNFGGRDKWTSTQACKVEREARIKIRSGEHDTFKVVCEDQFNARTYYLSPALETTVYSTRVNPRERDDSYEFIRAENK